MIISLIVAMAENRAIGKSGKLPWRLSADLKRFRELTTGHHIIMGRKTFDSIGRPLPDRQMIIITRQTGYQAEGCLTAHSLKEAIALAKARAETEAFICGGAEIYAQSLGLADRIYLTLVHAEVGADTFFPEWDETEWVEEETFHHEADEKNQYPFTFKSLAKKPEQPSQTSS